MGLAFNTLTALGNEDWYLSAVRQREWESCRKQVSLKDISLSARGGLEKMKLLLTKGHILRIQESCLWVLGGKENSLRNLNIDFVPCVDVGLKFTLLVRSVTMTLRNYFLAKISLRCLAKVNLKTLWKNTSIPQPTWHYSQSHWRWVQN